MSAQPPGQPIEMGELALKFLESLPLHLATALRAAAVPHWFDGELLAAMLAIPLEKANELKQSLAQMPLVQPANDSVYVVHELARRPILDQMWEEERREEYRAWSRRAADHLAQLEDKEKNFRLRIESIYNRLVGDPDKGADDLWYWGAEWYNHFELQKVFAVVQAGMEHDAAARLAGRARGWLYYRQGVWQLYFGENRAAEKSLRTALGSAARDDALRASCAQSLGDAYIQLDDFRQAQSSYEQALSIYGRIIHPLNEANCIKSLGDLHVQLDNFRQAHTYFEQALSIYRRIDSPLGEANGTKSLGDMLVQLGQFEEACKSNEEALLIYRDIGCLLGEANCMQSLGDLHVHLDKYESARKYNEAAMSIYVAVGSRLGEANSLKSLADVQVHLGVYEEAQNLYDDALTIYRTIASRLGEANCMKSLGDMFLRQEAGAQARTFYNDALAIYRAIGSRSGEANCIRCLAATPH